MNNCFVIAILLHFLFSMMKIKNPVTVPRLSYLGIKDNTVPEIRMATNHHDVNIRKWIHRFNEKGIEGIASKMHST